MPTPPRRAAQADNSLMAAKGLGTINGMLPGAGQYQSMGTEVSEEHLAAG